MIGRFNAIPVRCVCIMATSMCEIIRLRCGDDASVWLSMRTVCEWFCGPGRRAPSIWQAFRNSLTAHNYNWTAAAVAVGASRRYWTIYNIWTCYLGCAAECQVCDCYYHYYYYYMVEEPNRMFASAHQISIRQPATSSTHISSAMIKFSGVSIARCSFGSVHKWHRSCCCSIRLRRENRNKPYNVQRAYASHCILLCSWPLQQPAMALDSNR